MAGADEGTEKSVQQGSVPPRRRRNVLAILAALILILAALAGYLRFSTPDIPGATLEKAYAAAPSHFVRLPSGARVHVRESGPANAPVLLLIHGSTHSLFTWEKWRSQLSDRFRLIAFDLPGHGLTGPDPKARYSPAQMADFVEELRQTLKVDRWAIAGNSLGGEVAFRYAARYPDRTAALILLAPAGATLLLSDTEKRHGAQGFSLARSPVFRDIARYYTPKSLVRQGLFAAFANDRLVDRAYVDRYWRLMRRAGNRAAMLERLSARPDPLAPDPARLEQMRLVRAPTLILWGEADAILPARAAPQIQEAIPNSRLVLYPNVGHLLQEEAAQRSARDAAEFLALWRQEVEAPAEPEETFGAEP